MKEDKIKPEKKLKSLDTVLLKETLKCFNVILYTVKELHFRDGVFAFTVDMFVNLLGV